VKKFRYHISAYIIYRQEFPLVLARWMRELLFLPSAILHYFLAFSINYLDQAHIELKKAVETAFLREVS
jgi:hypothetical protein